MAGILYVVATPIGNLSDITNRMKEVFLEVDFIAAEDTRVTVKLLNHLEIKKPMISYYEHNIKSKGDYIIKRILDGESCAICSDAGTPCISDPGEVLVKQAHENNIKVVPIPGASAAITALSVSGQDTGRFCFEGFVSTSKKQRIEHLNFLKDEKRTMIFYEAPHKLLNTLKDFCEYFGEERKITIARQLTKMHEEIKIYSMKDAFLHYSNNNPKGEFVLVVEGDKTIKEVIEKSLDELAIDCLEISKLEDISLSEAAKKISSNTKFSKSMVYKLAQEMKSDKGE